MSRMEEFENVGVTDDSEEDMDVDVSVVGEGSEGVVVHSKFGSEFDLLIKEVFDEVQLSTIPKFYHLLA